jgi:hypothetical protein
MDLRPASEAHHDALNDAHAAYLRGEDYTFQQIADAMGCSISTAHARVNRAYGRMAGPKAQARRNADLKELEELKKCAWLVLERHHVIVQHGHVVTVEVNGEKVPVPDDHPVLEAMDRILKIQEREAKLLGLDAPVRHRLQVVPQDAVDAEIADRKRELALDEDDDVDIGDLLRSDA